MLQKIGRLHGKASTTQKCNFTLLESPEKPILAKFMTLLLPVFIYGYKSWLMTKRDYFLYVQE